MGFEGITRAGIGFAAVALVTVAGLAGCRPAAEPAKKAAATTGPAEVRVIGDVGQSLVLTADQVAALPHRTIRADGHDHKPHTYEGVPVALLLAKAGVPLGDRLRGTALAQCVVVEAADGYRASFAIAELDTSFSPGPVLLVDRQDGAAPPPSEGRLRIAAPSDRRFGRWVRMVTALRVRRL